MSAARTVVDASALVELLVSAGSKGEMVFVRTVGSQLHAPDHVAVEVVSALRRLQLAGELGEVEARLALEGLWQLTIQLWRLEHLAERTWALRHNLTAYDAAYVALAELLDVPLVTADARLARASGPECVIEVVA